MRYRQPGKGLKRWGPKHAVASRDSVHAVDRAIETRTRQAAQAEVQEGLDEYEDEA